MNQNNFTPNRADMLAHINFLFSSPQEYKDGLIEIAYTPSNNSAVNRASFFSLDEIEKAADFAFNTNAQEGVNVYIGAALRNPNTAPFGRSDLGDYYASGVVWCDLDDDGAANAAKDKYSKLPPSLIIVTGRHPHLRAQAWWKIMHMEPDNGILKQNLAHVCAALNGDPAVVDPARVMRLAGSIAWPKKEGRITELTELIKPNNATVVVSIDRFKSYFPGVAAPLLTANATSGGVGFDGKPRDIFTGKLKYKELLELTKIPGKWHDNMRTAVASMIGNGWTDEQIKLACAPYSDGGIADQDISVLLGPARQKWNKPDPETLIEPERYDPVTGEIKAKVLPIVYASDVAPVLGCNDFIENVLRDEEFSVIYGESNCGKTFFMLDLAMHVALGKPWRGLEVEQGGVIYAALEGGHGTKNRIAAFRKHYGLNNLDIPLAIIPSSINLLDEKSDIPALLSAIDDAKSRLKTVRLVVIDTLARAISGGDENSSQDMGKLIINADLIRARTKAHISFIHHAGKDTAKGARGHSSLRAAVDTEIEISRIDAKSPSVVKIVKQREMEMLREMAFVLESMELGQNKRGKPVTSCVVFPSEVAAPKAEKRLNAIQTFMYECIVDALIDYGVERQILTGSPKVKCVSYEDLNNVLYRRGYKEILATAKKTEKEQVKSTTQAARIGLKKAGKIFFDQGYIWLPDDNVINFPKGGM